MTNVQYSITTGLVLVLLLLCVPANPLPTSSSIPAEKPENDATTPRILEVQGSSSQEGNSESGTGYNNPYQEISYILKPPLFNNFDQYGNPLSRGNTSPSGNQNPLLYSSPYSAYQPHPSVLYRTKSSLALPSTMALTQQNMRLRQLNQRLLSQNGLRRGRYMYPNMYPTQNIYPSQFRYSYTPMPNVIPPPVNNAPPYYPQNPNVYPILDVIYPNPNQNSFIPQIYPNEQSQITSSQNTQQQNTNNVPSQDQKGDTSNDNQNSVQNQSANQNVTQQPNVSQNNTRNGNQNQNAYPSSDMQNGGGQNIYPGGMYPIQNINQFPNGIPIPYGGPDYNAPVRYQNPFPFGYQMPNQNVQFRPIST